MHAPLILHGTIAGVSVSVPLWSYVTGVQLAQQYCKAASSKRKGFEVLLSLCETPSVDPQTWIQLQRFEIGRVSAGFPGTTGDAPGAFADAQPSSRPKPAKT